MKFPKNYYKIVSWQAYNKVLSGEPFLITLNIKQCLLLSVMPIGLQLCSQAANHDLFSYHNSDCKKLHMITKEQYKASMRSKSISCAFADFSK